jgi:uncharacterized membrane protein
MVTIGLILFYFLTPFLIMFLCKKYSTLKKMGAVALSYITGIILGNMGIFPRQSEAFKELLQGKSYLPSEHALELFGQGVLAESDLVVNQIASTQDLVMTIVIPLSIPLLLFSLDIRNSVKTLRTGMLSMLIAVFSLLVCVIAGYLLFGSGIPESWKVSGMMIGLYTGGTPNLAALATALNVDPGVFIMTHTYDLIAGVFLLMFFITIAQRVFNKILPHFNGKGISKKPKQLIKESEAPENLIENFSKKNLVPLLAALGISVLIFAVGGGISLLVPSDLQMVTVILIITTLGIIVSLSPRIKKVEKTFELGMYLILVFSIAVSSMADLHSIFQIEMLNLFLYVLIAVFGSVIVHVILSAIFKIDTDTTIITITALSTSPPFVPVVAAALKNKEVIVMGITIGVLGYAIGNYLGVFFAYALKAIQPF